VHVDLGQAGTHLADREGDRLKIARLDRFEELRIGLDVIVDDDVEGQIGGGFYRAILGAELEL